MAGGGRGGGKVKKGNRDSNEPTRKTTALATEVVDSGIPLIDTVLSIDHYDERSYKTLIHDLRTILRRYDPKKSLSVMSDFFGIVFEKKGSPKKRKRKMIVYLRKLDAYFLAFYNKKLYQFGIEGVDVRIPLFYGSTFTGYKESYTDSLLDGLLVGYFALRDAIETIMDEAKEGEAVSQEVLFGWRILLIVIMVMLSEASRFHPIFHLTSDLCRCKINKKLPKGLAIFMRNWSKMTQVAKKERPDNRFIPTFPLDYDNIELAELMTESLVGAVKVLAFCHRGNISGEGTSQDCRFLKGGADFKLIAPPEYCLFLWFSSWWTRWLFGYCNRARG